MGKEIVEPKIRRRSDMKIIVDILEFIKRTPSRKTQVIMATGISHKILSNYIDKLVSGGYIIERPFSSKKGHFYAVSAQGGQIYKQLLISTELVREIMGTEG